MSYQKKLPVVDPYPLTVTPGTSVAEVLLLMSERHGSYVLVVADRDPNSRLLGLFTEQDSLRLAACGVELSNISITSVMRSQLVTIAQKDLENIFTAVDILHRYQIHHLPVVGEDGNLIGVITPQSIRNTLNPVYTLKENLVSDLMSSSVICSSTNVSLEQIVKLMVKERSTYVAIVDKVEAFEATHFIAKGIVTEGDIVNCCNQGLDLANTLAITIASKNFLQIQADDTLWTAYQKMQEHSQGQLLVLNQDRELVGIITQAEIMSVVNKVDTWDALERLQDLADRQTLELKQLYYLLKQEISDRKRVEIGSALQTVCQQEGEKAIRLEKTLEELKQAQSKLVISEKMASLGSLVAGVAHEINNPTCFIYSNIQPAMSYAEQLLELVRLYQEYYPESVPEIRQYIQDIDLDFIVKDFPKVLTSMQEGARRVSEIVLSLRNFSRFDEAKRKEVDIHEGINSTLLLLQHRLKRQRDRPEIKIIKSYDLLPKIHCYPGELNQVFMNLISNAIDAIEEKSISPKKLVSSCCCHTCIIKHPPIPQIKISTKVTESKIAIAIADSGCGIKKENISKIFDPFFTTKPLGKGKGLGLSIAYQIIVEQHLGQIKCNSDLERGTEFVIELPIN